LYDNGKGGESIYGMVYRDENFTITHDSKYLVTLTRPRSTPHTTNSQFMITLAPLKWLDDRYQVIGYVSPKSTGFIDTLE
jgi:peptidylprolyl isomerase